MEILQPMVKWTAWATHIGPEIRVATAFPPEDAEVSLPP